MGREAGGGAPRSQLAGGLAGESPRARAGAGGQARPSRYLLLDLPVLRDDPVRGGEGPSSRHSQQGGKAEEPAWAGARWQLAPAADPYCRRHLAPPAGPLTPEAEAGPRRPPSWGGRRWRRRSRGALPADDRLSQARFGCPGGAPAPPAFRSKTAYLLLISSARSDLGEREPEGEESEGEESSVLGGASTPNEKPRECVDTQTLK